MGTGGSMVLVNSNALSYLSFLPWTIIIVNYQLSPVFCGFCRFAAELALHDINQRRILKQYRLRMISNDTKVGWAGIPQIMLQKLLSLQDSFRNLHFPLWNFKVKVQLWVLRQTIKTQFSFVRELIADFMAFIIQSVRCSVDPIQISKNVTIWKENECLQVESK